MSDNSANKDIKEVPKDKVEIVSDDSSKSYKPTIAEQKLLEVLLNPESVGMTVCERCEVAGISRDSYYRIARKPEFKNLVKSYKDMVLYQDYLSVAHMVAKSAIKGNAQDRRLFLEWLNDFAPQKVDHDLNINIVRSFEREDK